MRENDVDVILVVADSEKRSLASAVHVAPCELIAPKCLAALSRALAASVSRSLAGAEVTSESSRIVAAAAT